LNTIDTIVFRTDASFKIGSGHVMRCLTLAEALRNSGVKIRFVCRGHSGNLIELIRAKEFVVHELPVSGNFEYGGISDYDSGNEYGSWLGTSQIQDAHETISVFQNNRPGWLIVDHYGLGQVWEKEMRPHVHKIMAIDDLAQRPHDCDLLLDQNYFQDGDSRYNGLVPLNCTKMLGPQFALLRPEFAEAQKNLKSRTKKVQRIFIFFGGTDPDNITGKALVSLSFPEFSHLDVDVVIGTHNHHLTKIERLVKKRPNTSLHVQIENMAELMVQADLALGAGGATTLERMAVGLPSIVVTIAENQVPPIRDLSQDGYLKWLGNVKMVDEYTIYTAMLETMKNIHILHNQSHMCQKLIGKESVNSLAQMLFKVVSDESCEKK
jgi:UDP-2,4-diacetamido-2,4,6-trideoxy-beta-L-altropyranose hydrolase